MLSLLLISTPKVGSNKLSSLLEEYLVGLPLPIELWLKKFTHTVHHLLADFSLPMVLVNLMMISQTFYWIVGEIIMTKISMALIWHTALVSLFAPSSVVNSRWNILVRDLNLGSKEEPKFSLIQSNQFSSEKKIHFRSKLINREYLTFKNIITKF